MNLRKYLFHFLRSPDYVTDVNFYLPKFLKKDAAFAETQRVLSWEHEQYRLKIIDFAKQFQAQTATWGLRDWEAELGLPTDLNADLELRRAKVLAKLLGTSPMTVANTNKLINFFTDDGTAYVEELPKPGTIKIIIPSEKFYLEEMQAALDEMLPAHLVYFFQNFIEIKDKINESLTIDENRNMVVNITKSAKEIYQWRGRFFDSSWTLTPQVLFDNSWLFDGEYKFDNVPVGEVDKLNQFFRFNGDWFFGADSKFGYPISRKILWGTDEPDELFVNLHSAIREKYEIILPFEKLGEFSDKFQFGMQNAPIDFNFNTCLKSILNEAINLAENQCFITKINVILQEIYPLVRAKFFDNTWRFASVWKFGKDWSEKFGDTKFNPFEFKPLKFFTSDKNFSGDWKFSQLPFTEAFFSEDDAENLYLTYDNFSPEILQPAEEKSAQLQIKFADNIHSQKTWSDKEKFSGFKKFGEGQINFEKPPNFSEEKNFNKTWAFGSAERFFSANWHFGAADFDYSDDWHFGGEEFFDSKKFEENAGTKIQAKISDRLEHAPIFGNAELIFDDSWQIGKSKSVGESLKLEIIVGLKFDESWQFGMGARIFNSDWNFGEDCYCYGEFAEPKRKFNDTWQFSESVRFERRWNYFGQNRFSS